MLRDDQIRRYARHVLVPDVGGIGQERLLAATVRIERTRDPEAAEVAAIYLAAAGVGTIVIDDPALAARLTALNPDVRVVADGDGTDLALPDLDLAPIAPRADALVRGGVAACQLIHRLTAAS